MPYQKKIALFGDEPHSLLPVTGVAPPYERVLLRRSSRRVLEENLNRVWDQLAGPESAVDTDRVRETLLSLSAAIQSGSSFLRNSDFYLVLTRLTRIYDQGFGPAIQSPFTSTAAAYAQVVEALSHANPGQDYGEAVGQLLCYMSRLFRAQDQSWKLVYEHLLSIPDSVEAKRLLNRAFFAEIQEWAEAGVDNLFSIRKDLYAKIDQLEAKIERLERRIERGSEDLNQRGPTSTDINYSNVIDLAKARAKRLIMALKHRRQGLIDEKENEKSIIDFIESDIQEFEEKLRNTRRAYFLRAV